MVEFKKKNILGSNLLLRYFGTILVLSLNFAALSFFEIWFVFNHISFLPNISFFDSFIISFFEMNEFGVFIFYGLTLKWHFEKRYNTNSLPPFLHLLTPYSPS